MMTDQSWGTFFFLKPLKMLVFQDAVFQKILVTGVFLLQLIYLNTLLYNGQQQFYLH